jgi:hypothetical protein
MGDEGSFLDRLIGKPLGPYGDDQDRVEAFLERVRQLDFATLSRLSRTYWVRTTGGDPNRIRYAIALAMEAARQASLVRPLERVHEEIRRLVWNAWWIADYSNADFEMVERDAAVGAIADAAWAMLLGERLLPSVHDILIATWGEVVGPLELTPRLSFDDIEDPEDRPAPESGTPEAGTPEAGTIPEAGTVPEFAPLESWFPEF